MVLLSCLAGKMNKSLLALLGIQVVLMSCSSAPKQVNSSERHSEDPRTDLARCLANGKVELYSVDYCPFCEKQKKLFGDQAWKILQPNVIDCGNLLGVLSGEQAQICNDRQIFSYPTWVFGDGKRVAGFLDFEQLEDYSGCKYEP